MIFRMCGICVAEYRVRSPPYGCGTAATARGSIAMGISRCCTYCSLDGERRSGERLVDLALVALDLEVPRVALVGAELLVDDDAIAERVVEVDDRLERLVGHVDCLDRVARRCVAGGQHACHAVARVRGHGDGEGVVRGVLHVGGHRPRARHGPGPQRGEVRAAVRGDHAGHRGSARQVDASDSGVRVRAAQQREVQRARDVEVVGVLGLAGEQCRVFAAQQPLTHDGGGPFFGDGHDHSFEIGNRRSRCQLPAAQASTACTML